MPSNQNLPQMWKMLRTGGGRVQYVPKVSPGLLTGVDRLLIRHTGWALLLWVGECRPQCWGFLLFRFYPLWPWSIRHVQDKVGEKIKSSLPDRGSVSLLLATINCPHPEQLSNRAYKKGRHRNKFHYLEWQNNSCTIVQGIPKAESEGLVAGELLRLQTKAPKL